MHSHKGQSLVEYAMVVGIIALVMVAMTTPFKRSVMLVVKVVADSLGFHSGAEQASNIEEGYMANARVNTQTSFLKTTTTAAGIYAISETENTQTTSASTTNLGVTPDDTWTH